jgi:hypothetical protein
MKTTSLNQLHLTGKTAYSIFWVQAFDCTPDFETITSTYLNLEIVIDRNGELTAYKYDVVDELSDLLENAGEWQDFEPEIIARVKEFFRMIDEDITNWKIRQIKAEIKRISSN